MPRHHLDQTIGLFGSGQSLRSFLRLPGADAGLSALAYAACCLWSLGYPEQALRRSEEALSLAKELGHPFSLADVLCFGGCLFSAMRRNAPALKRHAEELARLAQEWAPTWREPALSFRRQAAALLGAPLKGIGLLLEGIAAYESILVRCDISGALFSLGEARARAGQPGEALITLGQAPAFADETDQRYWEAEIHRVRAEVLLMQAVPQPVIPGLIARTGIEGDAGLRIEAEASLQKATDVARRQQAKSWELRATTSLARLWQARGRIDAARQMLAAV